MIWYKDNRAQIVISTRIRLARNLKGIPFPSALQDKTETTKKIKDSILSSNSTLSKTFGFFEIDALPLEKISSLKEEHLISPQMNKGLGQSVLLSDDKTMSIMLMEEDHIRLQIIEKGLCLMDAYKTASRVDDIIEESIEYAFDAQFGYLTSCPTNTGTGMRASVMLHLPALTQTDNIARIMSHSSALGIAVRGMYGEGSKAYGNLYQLSNQVTMGMSEEDIIKKLSDIVNQIIEAEKKARALLMEQNQDYIKDKVMRSYGIAKYAHKMASSEAKDILSDIILGQNLGIIKESKISPIEMLICLAPSIIGGSTADERDIKRAEYIREKI